MTVLMLSAACESESPETQPGTTAPATAAAPAGAAEVARVGAADSGCALPVTFGLAKSYTPKATPVTGELADLLKKGPMSMACEIDAKPAGNIGFLRVYTGAAGDLRAGLTGFIGTAAEAPAFTELTIGGVPGIEVTYREESKLDAGTTPERAFAVGTPQGTVVVALDSLDGEEHEAILPAYELAKSSLTIS